MDTINLLIKIWINKKLRNGIILGVLSIILISIILNLIFNKEPPPPPGAIRVVICSNCKKKMTKRIYKIEEAICDYCKKKGTLKYGWKCGKCQYEYYPVPYKFKTEKLNTMQRFEKMEQARACPNCGETRDVAPMSVKK